MNSPSTPNKIFNNQFVLRKKLSSGSYGIVFEAEDIIKKQMVAVKIEKKEKNSTLDREIHILTRLQGTQGVPKLIWSGTDNNTNVLVQSLLTKDIGAYLKEFRKFSLKTVLIITDYLLQVIRRIHNKSVVHRDLKPENIMYHFKQIYIVDFGISKLYRDNNLKHVPFKEGRSFVGTTRYASVAAHKGQEIGRKDDLESIIYIDILMLKGYDKTINLEQRTLPWQNMLGQNNKDRQKQVGEKKMKMTPQEICIDLPIEFAKALEYIRSLNYQSDPDYEYLIQMFRKLASLHKIEYDDIYDWSQPASQPSTNQKQENLIKQISSLQQFERSPLTLQNKCHSLRVPSTHDIAQDRKRSLQNSTQILLLPDDAISKSIENTYQLSGLVMDLDQKQDYVSQDDANDTLFSRYYKLKTQHLSMQVVLNIKSPSPTTTYETQMKNILYATFNYIFNQLEMQKLIGKYSYNMNHLIGRGAYGSVYEGLSKEGFSVAIKVIDRRMINQTNQQQLFNEIQSMKQLNHQNIVRFIDFYETQNNFYIISEFCNGGDLRAVIKQGKLSSKSVIKILRQILNGYCELYKQQIIHRDIKPANILLHQGNIKLADFGFAKKIDFENDLMTSMAGTPLYMAPQVVLRQPYTAKCDIWSLGMILYELLFTKPPFSADNIIQLQEKICKPIKVPQLDNAELQKIITGCLQFKEDDRLSWDEIYQSSLLKVRETEQLKFAGILVEVEPDQTDYRKFLISNYLSIEFEANQRTFINQLNFARSAFNFSFFIQNFDQTLIDLAQNFRNLAFYWLLQFENPKFFKEYQKFQSHDLGQYCSKQLQQMRKAFLDNSPEIPNTLGFNLQDFILSTESYSTQFNNQVNALNRNQLLFTFMIKQISKILKTFTFNDCFQFLDLYQIQQLSDQEIVQKIQKL